MNGFGNEQMQKKSRGFARPQTELDCNPERFFLAGGVQQHGREKLGGGHVTKGPPSITEIQPREERKEKVSFTNKDSL